MQIESGKEMGRTSGELRKTLPELADSVIDPLLKLMIDEFVIIKTGVVVDRFVAAVHAKPWVLHSFKMRRTKVSLEHFWRQENFKRSKLWIKISEVRSSSSFQLTNSQKQSHSA